MCFRHFGWFKPSFHLVQNLWLPPGPSHFLLSSSIIVPLPLLSLHPLLWKLRHSQTYSIQLCFSMLRLYLECLQTLAYNLLGELLGVSLLMDRLAFTEEDFWQRKCHMAPNGSRKIATCKRYFLEKSNWIRLAPFSIKLCDIIARSLSYYAVFLICVSLISLLSPLKELNFVLR